MARRKPSRTSLGECAWQESNLRKVPAIPGAAAENHPGLPRSAGVCQSQSAFRSDAQLPSESIPRLQPSAEWGWRERPAFNRGREMVYVRNPGCFMGTSPTLRDNGVCRLELNRPQFSIYLYPSPFSGVGWGVRSGSNSRSKQNPKRKKRFAQLRFPAFVAVELVGSPLSSSSPVADRPPPWKKPAGRWPGSQTFTGLA
jgi:hypothetical protein